MGPVRFFRRTVSRLNSVGWFRAAGSLSFVTLLGLVPLATVAFAFYVLSAAVLAGVGHERGPGPRAL